MELSGLGGMWDSPHICSLLLLLLQLLGQKVMPSAALVRVKDKSFPNTTWLFDRLVTCNDSVISDLVYPSETWSCRDMRIDGYRLRYLYRVPDHQCTDLPDEYENFGKGARRNDVSGLCEALLRANGIYKPLSVAFVHDPSCGHSGKERMLLVHNSSAEHGYSWELYAPGHGYMRTLRCMLRD